MNLLYVGPADAHFEAWRQVIARELPDVDFRADSSARSDESFLAAMAYRPPQGRLSRIPGLKMVFALGAGVDGLLASGLPEAVDLVRMVNPAMIEAMADYVDFAVMRYHRGFDGLERDQRGHVWSWGGPTRPKSATRVGVLGLGRLGAATAVRLAAQGYAVRGWSRTAKSLPNVRTFTGADELPALLADTDILVNLLPLTPATRDLLDIRLFERLPRGARLIHAGRGEQLVEDHLLQALADGRLAGATLDVFKEEPLPPAHPFWSHPRIRITPHCASYSTPEDCWPLVRDALDRLKQGQPPATAVSREAGY